MATPGPRTTYRYSKEFKSAAVRLSQLSGVSVKDVADSPYILSCCLFGADERARNLGRKL